MISDADKIFMKAARADMLAGRTYSVYLLPSDITSVDPETDEPIKVPQQPIEVQAHVTESSGDQLQISDGQTTWSADIKCDVNIEDWHDVDYFEYDGHTYRVIAKPKKGISERNRIEVLGRLAESQK